MPLENMDRTGRGHRNGPKLTKEKLRNFLDIYKRQGFNKAATARHLRITRETVRKRLERAVELGLTVEVGVSEKNVSRDRLFDDARQAQIDQFARVEEGGTYQTPRPIPLTDDKPFVLIALGDPHLDNPGTDLHLWERWIEPLQEDVREPWVRSVCMGDMTDNWLRFLGFLNAESEMTERDAWTLLEGYLDQIGEAIDALILGNHDLWKNALALEYLGDKCGIRLTRAHGATAAYTTPEGRVITVGMRHRFVGHSQWNAVHAITKAAQMGWRENILIGGDKHISGRNWVKDPMTGKITHCYQLAAFKMIDSYAEEKGFQDQHITPAVALVIDPACEDDDPRLVKTFDCPQEAVDYVAFLRSR